MQAGVKPYQSFCQGLDILLSSMFSPVVPPSVYQVERRPLVMKSAKSRLLSKIGKVPKSTGCDAAMETQTVHDFYVVEVSIVHTVQQVIWEIICGYRITRAIGPGR